MCNEGHDGILRYDAVEDKHSKRVGKGHSTVRVGDWCSTFYEELMDMVHFMKWVRYIFCVSTCHNIRVLCGRCEYCV